MMLLYVVATKVCSLVFLPDFVMFLFVVANKCDGLVF